MQTATPHTVSQQQQQQSLPSRVGRESVLLNVQRQRDDGGGLVKMAALSEDGRYGLNCGRQSADRVTVLHVKLTETALRAIESYQNCKVSESTGFFSSSRLNQECLLTRVCLSW